MLGFGLSLKGFTKSTVLSHQRLEVWPIFPKVDAVRLGGLGLDAESLLDANGLRQSVFAESSAGSAFVLDEDAEPRPIMLDHHDLDSSCARLGDVTRTTTKRQEKTDAIRDIVNYTPYVDPIAI